MESHSPHNNQPSRDFDGAVMTKELPLKDNITRSILDHNHSFPPWTCQKCSNINELGVTNCEVCQTPRGACPRCGLVNPTTALNCIVCNALLGPPRGDRSIEDFQTGRAVSELSGSSSSRTSSPIPDGSLGLQKGFLDRLYRRYMEHFRVDMCKDPRKCSKGPYMCFDAHAQSALRRKPECMADPVTGLPRWNYFPKLCRLMSDQVLCQNAKCRFAHSMQEIVYHPLLYKTKLCAHVLDSSGHCQGYGIHCSKAHSQEELRSPGPLDVLSPDLTKMDKFADRADSQQKLSLSDSFKYTSDKFDRLTLGDSSSSHREPRSPTRDPLSSSQEIRSKDSRDFPFHVADISLDVRHRERDHHHHRRDSLRDSERDRRDRDRARERHHSQDFSLNQRIGNHTILSNAYSSVKDGPLPKPLREIYMYQYKTGSCEVQGCKLCNKFHNMKERRRGLGDYDYTALPCLKVFNPQTNTWKEPNRCPKGDTCPQAHTKVESMYHPENYKTQICGKAEESVCSWGVACAFAHGERDLSKYFRDPEELLPGHSYKQKASTGGMLRRDRNSDSNPPRYEGDWPQQSMSRSPGTSPVQRTLHSGSPSSDYQPRNSNSSNPGSRSSESMSASESNRDSFSANSDGSRGSVSVHSNDSRSSVSLSHGPDHQRGAGSAPLPNGLISMMMSHGPDATLSDGSTPSASLFNSFNNHKKEETKSSLQFPIPVDGYSFSSTSAPPSPYSVSSTGSRSKIVGPLAITDVYEKEHRRSEELVAVVRRLQSEVEDLMRKVQCPVCLDRERSVALVPCGHVLCEKCQNDIHVASSNTKSCPLCNKEITQSLAVLL